MMEEFYKTKVKEIMIPDRDTPFMEENASWVEFLSKLSLRAHAWVVNNTEEMKVVGVVTEHDMLRSIIPPGQRKEKMFGIPRAHILHKESVVQDIMTHNPVVCSPEETVADVLKKFSSFNIRRLAVVDENKRLLGELTIQLLARNLRDKFLNTL
ncbi:MAG TPA: CBS domain-containing protein [Dehalococcoidia bacterium]|nr:CBS domain-containing protein [Dehalococcoidia bacterium]